MRLHYLQHVSFEDAGIIKDWAEEKGCEVSKTAFFDGDCLPSIDEIDFLVVMGGPMGIYDEDVYPWLKDEKAFISEAIQNGKAVLGICLGAQLIADVMGAEVTKNREREIGWFNVKVRSSVFNIFSDEFMAFHWHSDTFRIPDSAELLASTEACINQAFASNDGKVVALQFHLEVTEDSIKRLMENCADELIESRYVQDEKEIIDGNRFVEDSNLLMRKLLDDIQRKII